LETLTKKGWWTVSSQPAVDGASSSDEVVGWGPVGGYVFQKPFVEFFAELEDVERIERRVESEGRDMVHFYAGNKTVSVLQGHLRVLLPLTLC
jgi:methylenetetrahydrofolate reductase (NADPH)